MLTLQKCLPVEKSKKKKQKKTNNQQQQQQQQKARPEISREN